MTSEPDPEIRQLLRRAHDGDPDALGKVLQQYRPYLRLLALRALEGPLAARLDPSDVVQQTFLSAFRNFGKFAGDKPAEFLAWVAQIHERNLQDAAREHMARKRSVAKEQPLDEGAGFVDVRASSPSQRALQGERAVHLAQALEALPEDQREAVRLRHLEGWTLAEIAARLNRTERAVGALVSRGLASLRKRIPN